MACIGPSLNSPPPFFAQKDAPGQTRHRVKFIASKYVTRLSGVTADTVNDSPTFSFFLVLNDELREMATSTHPHPLLTHPLLI